MHFHCRCCTAKSPLLCGAVPAVLRPMWHSISIRSSISSSSNLDRTMAWACTIACTTTNITTTITSTTMSTHTNTISCHRRPQWRPQRHLSGAVAAWQGWLAALVEVWVWVWEAVVRHSLPPVAAPRPCHVNRAVNMRSAASASQRVRWDSTKTILPKEKVRVCRVTKENMLKNYCI